MLAEKQLQQLDLNLLKVFEVLYQERNMTAASKALFISPSAVSHAMKRLKEALGDELFVRKGQQMEPTPACTTMAPEIIELLVKLRKVLQQCGEFELAKTQQTFVLAIHDALEPIVLPQLHRELAKQAPKARLKSVKLERDLLVRQLSNRQVDLVVDVARPIKAPIRHQALSSDHFVVLMDKQRHPEVTLTEADYLSAEHIAVSNRSDGHVVEDIAFLQLGVNRNIKTRCQNFHTAKALVKQSNNLLTLPNHIAQQLVDDTLQIVPLPMPLPSVATHMYWHQDTEQDPAMEWLRQALQSSFVHF